MTAVLAEPRPVAMCPVCDTEHWRCVWCLRHPRSTNQVPKVTPSEWEQQQLRSDDWATLCTKCAAKRLKNPYNSLLPMRRRSAA